MPRELSPFEQRLNELAASVLPIPFQQKILFVENLRIMIKAGLSVVEALVILVKQTTNLRLKHYLGDIAALVEKGTSFSDALKQRPKALPAVYARMIAAGESSGTLETALAHVEQQMKCTHELNSRIRGAMIYPIIVILALIAIGIEMLWFVLPKLLNVFEEFDATLPLATRILIALSNFVLAYGLFIALALAALVISYFFLYRVAVFKALNHALFLRIPIIGGIVKKINLARFSTTMHSLLGSGLSIIDALSITTDVLVSMPYKTAVHNATQQLKKGSDLSRELEQSPALFPPMMTSMLATGERTGKIEDLLSEVAQFYNDTVERTLKNLNTIIEPLIILFLGAVVAAMAVAVIMPMLTLTQSI